MAEQKTNHAPRNRRGGFGPPGAGMPVAKAKNTKKALRELVRYLAPFRVQLILALALTVVSTTLSVLGPRLAGESTTLLFEGLQRMLLGQGGIDWAAVGQTIVRMLLLYGLSVALWIATGFILARVATTVAYNLRVTLLAKMQRLPVSYFNKTSHGDVLSRVTNDVDTLNQSLNQGVSQILSSVTMILGLLVMMFTTSALMAAAALAVVPVMLVVVGFVVKASQKYYKAQQDYLGAVNGQVEEVYAGHTVVKAFGGEAQVTANFETQNQKLYGAAWRAQFFSGVMQPVAMLLGNVNYVVVCILGASLVVAKTLPIGVITEFIMYIRQFNQPFMQLAQMMSIFQQTAAASERVFEFLAEQEESTVADAALPAVRGDVRFEHVRFGYEDSDEIVINDFSANIKSGQKVAIVGPTGAGKTTLVKLLMRFHDLSGGAIYIDGHDIVGYPRGEVRKAMGMVLQDTWLTNASIADNIRYGRLDATEEEVKAAAKAAQAHHFIKALPDGYGMEINEEANNISQGQKQLLTIARAVLADARILILDEATSSVDTRTEILIQKAMDHLMEGRTSFIIAHRLSTIRNADLILCLDHGDIVEQGTHEELLEKDGFYANIYNSQFEKVSA
ncbi:MAG: ABC transporter ATP-binding protein/permease [Oscillospiraceae bacterium]|jgi:ATP-binding cassette subfamily B protein|nr:ABC transporter ATP-binding protein/permease [Oscillospiraceae bacterium]